MKCIDCPFVRRSFMNRTCGLTGKQVPIFAELNGCPLNQDTED